MDNFAVIALMVVAICKYKHSDVAKIIAMSCLTLECIYHGDMDIALYYGIASMVSVVTGIYAINLKSTTGYALAIVMLFQAALTLSLVPDWNYQVNDILQFELKQFNATMVILLILLGFIGSDNDRPTDRGDNP